jgi:hypothetical protein
MSENTKKTLTPYHNKDHRNNKVSWGTKHIKDYIIESSLNSQDIPSQTFAITPESPKDMETSQDSPSPAPEVLPNFRRPISQLFSEFDPASWIPSKCVGLNEIVSCSIQICENEKENYESSQLKKNRNSMKNYGFNDKASPKVALLTPVREESESAHSSGENLIKKNANFSDSSENGSKFMTEPNSISGYSGNAKGSSKKFEVFLADYKSKVIESNESFRFINSAIRPMPQITWKSYSNKHSVSPAPDFTKKRQLEKMHENLAVSLQEMDCLIEQNKKCKEKMKVYEESQQKLQEIIQDLQNPIQIDRSFGEFFIFNEGPIEKYSANQRWKITSKTSTLIFYRHLSTFQDNQCVSNLLLKLFLRNEGFSVKFELLKAFSNDNLNKMFNVYFDFVASLVEFRPVEDILSILSSRWLTFIKFTESLEKLKLAVDYDLIIGNRSTTIQGSLFGQSWNYNISYSSLDIYWDIFNEVRETINKL